jgi:hypothetical protein
MDGRSRKGAGTRLQLNERKQSGTDAKQRRKRGNEETTKEKIEASPTTRSTQVVKWQTERSWLHLGGDWRVGNGGKNRDDASSNYAAGSVEWLESDTPSLGPARLVAEKLFLRVLGCSARSVGAVPQCSTSLKCSACPPRLYRRYWVVCIGGTLATP